MFVLLVVYMRDVIALIWINTAKYVVFQSRTGHKPGTCHDHDRIADVRYVRTKCLNVSPC